MPHLKTRGRELALQYLYMNDALSGRDVQTLDEYLAQQQPLAEAEAAAFARLLVEAVLDHQEDLDREISAVALNWKLSRMAIVDRNILRVGLAELLACPDTPYKVIINEAVELARRFSSENACAFVNGLLDKLRLQHRPAPEASPATAEVPPPIAEVPPPTPEGGAPADAP
jgi:transcription antitermination protein NusB